MVPDAVAEGGGGPEPLPAERDSGPPTSTSLRAAPPPAVEHRDARGNAARRFAARTASRRGGDVRPDRAVRLIEPEPHDILRGPGHLADPAPPLNLLPEGMDGPADRSCDPNGSRMLPLPLHTRPSARPPMRAHVQRGVRPKPDRCAYIRRDVGDIGYGAEATQGVAAGYFPPSTHPGYRPASLGPARSPTRVRGYRSSLDAAAPQLQRCTWFL